MVVDEDQGYLDKRNIVMGTIMLVDQDTIKKYIELIKHGKVVGVRETQRILGFRSPGKAQRFLDRLVKAGLAVKNSDGKYVLVEKPVNVSGYMIIRGFIVPKILLANIFASLSALTYMVLGDIDNYTRIMLLTITIPYHLLTIDAYLTLNKLKKQTPPEQ